MLTSSTDTSTTTSTPSNKNSLTSTYSPSPSRTSPFPDIPSSPSNISTTSSTSASTRPTRSSTRPCVLVSSTTSHPSKICSRKIPHLIPKWPYSCLDTALNTMICLQSTMTRRKVTLSLPKQPNPQRKRKRNLPRKYNQRLQNRQLSQFPPNPPKKNQGSKKRLPNKCLAIPATNSKALPNTKSKRTLNSSKSN